MTSLPPAADAALQHWITALEARHLSDLTFQEVARALRALSSCYVERRSRLAGGDALDGQGKRAAFALFYAPLHFALTAHIASALQLGTRGRTTIVDVGCGTGAAGAAWAVAEGSEREVLGIDRSAWAVRESEWTWRLLGVRGHAVKGDVSRLRWPKHEYAAVAAFTANELPPPSRHVLRDRLLAAAAEGRAVLVIEPLARAAAPWWNEWAQAFHSVGAQQQTWRAALSLPDLVKRLDRAAGLDHRELTARSLSVARREKGSGGFSF